MSRDHSLTDRYQTPAVPRGLGPRAGQPRRRPKGISPSAESLEDRCLLAQVVLSNGIPVNTVGAFSYTVDDGGRGRQAIITANGTSGLLTGVSALFANVNYVDVGADGAAVGLDSTTIIQSTASVSQGVTVSRGSFAGVNGLINWRVTTQLLPDSLQVVNTVEFTSANPLLTLGALNFINYLDEDVLGISDDILYAPGIPGSPGFQVFTLDGAERIGFSQGGVYSRSDPRLLNATWLGYAADRFPQLQTVITGATVAAFNPGGNIDRGDLRPSNDISLGQVFGPNDVTTALGYSVDPTANTATITTFLTLNPNTAAFNRNPVAGNDGGTSVNGAPVRVNVLGNDSDIDGSINPTTVTITTDPTRGVATVNLDGSITYTPAQGTSGTDAFTYTVADNEGAISNRATVVITVSVPPTPPGPPPPTNVTAPTVPLPPVVPDIPITPPIIIIDEPDIPLPVDLSGPRVRDVFRFGTGRNRTAIVVTFDEALNPALAANFANYVIVAEGRRGSGVIPIESATYDPGSRSVKLFPSRRLDLARRFRLTIRANNPTGVADARGRLLDGNEDGRAGGDFNGRIRRFGRV